jgi:hypothetical protein
MNAASWVTHSELREQTGWDNKTIQRMRDSGKLPWRVSEPPTRGRNGELVREYLFSAASKKVADSNALAVVAAPQMALPILDSAERSAVPAELEPQARERFEKFVQPLLEFELQKKQSHSASVKSADGKIVDSAWDMAAYVASRQRTETSQRTVHRWFKRFKKNGYAALADKVRKDRGRSRFFEVHKAAALYIQQKFLNEGLTYQLCWEALRRDWKKVEGNSQPPCEWSVRNFLSALPKGTRVLAREGAEAYTTKCSPSVRRKSPPPMEWWILDHRVFDVMTRNTLFPEMRKDQAYRLWLTAIYDWGSRVLVGFAFAPTPSSRTINSALRIAALTYGFPSNLYWDNGKDFKKVKADLELMTLSTEAQSLLGKTKIGVTSALPKHPRSKPIESYFSGWSKRFDPLWGVAYLGSRPDRRPERARIAEKQHHQYLAGKRAESPLPTDADFIAGAVQWIAEYNAEGLKALNGHTPAERMEEHNPATQRQRVDPRLLDILLSERTTRKVKRGGFVQLDKMPYEPVEESIGALARLEDKEVTILRDPYNLGEAVAVDSKTLQFIGELRIQPFLEQAPNGQINREQIRAEIRKQRQLKRFAANYLESVKRIAWNFGWKPESELLLERAKATGTYGPAVNPSDGPSSLHRAAPGARRALLSGGQNRANESAPTFISDAVAEDAHLFEKIEMEE